MGICSRLWNLACDHMLLKDDLIHSIDLSDEAMLKEAHREMMQAHNLFSRVEDAEMIDYAVLNLIAAEKRYNYYLKKIKNRT
ncbi:MAG: DUF2508 family protein [Syntrophomonadaceae bacterium]|nr:DUF2508 family protein [Syntrophomonadaceae bacterium]MDD3022734.1 DUF2508 family protein [Syntrophomonadaceae bacterium]